MTDKKLLTALADLSSESLAMTTLTQSLVILARGALAQGLITKDGQVQHD